MLSPERDTGYKVAFRLILQPCTYCLKHHAKLACRTRKAPGLHKPLVYAAATCGFFLWLDKKASGPAKKAISLQPKEYDRAAIAAAILEFV